MEHRRLCTMVGDLNKLIYVQNDACHCWYNHNWRISAIKCTLECHQGTLFTPEGKTTLCGFAIADSSYTIQSNEWVKGQPHAGKNGRNPELSNVSKISCCCYKIFLWSLWTSSHQMVNVPFPWTWADIYDYVDQWNKAKVTLCNFKASHKRHVLVPCSFLEGRLHAVKNLNNHVQRTRVDVTDDSLCWCSTHQATSTASPWSEWGFK